MVTNSKMMGALHVPRKTAPVIVGILLAIILHNVSISYCFKTMDTVHQLESKVQPVSYSKVPLLWKSDSGSKSYPTSAVKSTNICETSSSSSKTLSSKCRKEHTMRKLQNQEKKWKTRSKIYEKMNLISVLPETPRSLMSLKKLTPDSIHEINTFIKKKRRYCKLHDFEGFPCKKLKFVTWLARQMEKNTTKITSWLEFVKKSDNDTVEHSSSSSKDLSSIKPDIWPEKVVYRLIKSWGDPDDLFTFYKYKDFIKSRELKVSLPYEVVLKISPRSSDEHETQEEKDIGRSNSVGSARIFWDPGFNLKLKLPFFRDELSE